MMNEEHRDLLKKCRASIIRTIVAARCLKGLIDEMESKDKNGDYGLTPANITAIWGGRGSDDSDQVRTFLDILPTRGEYAFERFKQAIIEIDQKDLIAILNSELPANQQIKPKNTASATTGGGSAPSSASSQSNQGSQSVEEFDAAVEIDKIINIFIAIPKEKIVKLKKVLPPVLVKELNDCRELFANIELQDLVNHHMSAVLPDGTIKKIRRAIDDSNGAYEMCESLKKSSILALFTFLKGLQSTNQDHICSSYCTEAFCKELLSILDKI